MPALAGKRSGKSAPKRRSGVTVNQRDLLAIPHPAAVLLWRDLHVRDIRKVEGRQQTDNVRIELIVEGIAEDNIWKCGLEFDYANEESFYCRPLRLEQGRQPERMPIPLQAGSVQMAFLLPMSGLATTETRLDQGATNVRIGEGRTAEVLRNLCFRILEEDNSRWQLLTDQIKLLFAVELDEPRYIAERGEIVMGYQEHGVSLDLSSSGRGLQQTLLILACMYANPGAVVLLDEPDAHLEILRQHQIYSLITEVARDNGNQIIAASHSEVLLNEAADKDLVIAFVGGPHRIDHGQGQVRKALAEIGFDQYYQAEQAGWVLYLEGSTDLAILKAFARRVGKHEALQVLERPFVRYVRDSMAAARHHFHGLREAIPDLKGVALFDRSAKAPQQDSYLEYLVWERREIENYLCTEATLEAYAQASAIASKPMPLFTPAEVDRRSQAMQQVISEISVALERLGKGSPWDKDMKVSDEFLMPLFSNYFKRLELPNLMRKGSFHELVNWVPENEIDPEIGQKLDAIAAVAQSAAPAPHHISNR